MAKETVTIYDVAREAGVSMATASRVVNNNPNVKPATREKVSAVIKRLKYRPNAVARGLASKRTTTIGVIIPDVTNLYFSTLARGIDDIASMYKYNIILANSDGDKEKEVKVFQTLLAQQVDGVIFMGHNISEAMRDEIDRTDTPIVLAGSVDEEGKLPSVNIDYQKSTKDVLSMLHKNGHHRIALVTSRQIEPVKFDLRVQAIQEAYAEEGLEYSDDLVIDSTYDYDKGPDILKELSDKGITAAIVTSDIVAASILGVAIDQGVVIPDDLEIVSTANSAITTIMRPQLTTIAQPLYDIGAVSMRMLTKMMSEEEIDDKEVILPYTIAERGSTK